MKQDAENGMSKHTASWPNKHIYIMFLFQKLVFMVLQNCGDIQFWMFVFSSVTLVWLMWLNIYNIHYWHNWEETLLLIIWRLYTCICNFFQHNFHCSQCEYYAEKRIRSSRWWQSVLMHLSNQTLWDNFWAYLNNNNMTITLIKKVFEIKIQSTSLRVNVATNTSSQRACGR